MPTDFPASLDAYSNPSGSGTLAAEGHSTHHANHNDAVEALEAKVGVDDSAVSTSLDYLLNAVLGVFTKGELSVAGATTATIGRMHLCTGSSYTVTLPAAAGNAGRLIGFRMAPISSLTGRVTLQGTDEPGTGTGSIDHAASRVMWAGEVAVLQCDGADWFKVAGRSVPMYCAMRRSSNYSPVNHATITQVLIDTALVDNTGAMADAANHRITCQRTGNYRMVGRVHWAGISANASRSRCQINVDGAEAAGFEQSALSGTFGGAEVVTHPVALAAGSLITLHAYQNSGVAQTTYGEPAGAHTSLTVEEVPAW